MDHVHQRRAEQFRSSVLALLASVVGVAPGCVARTSDTGTDTPEVNGTSEDIIDPAPPPQETDAPAESTSEPTEPPRELCSEFGAPGEGCYERMQLESMMRNGTGQIPLEPPRSDAEVQAAFLENGCLPMRYVADGCCNAAVTEALVKDGKCCYTHCQGACCGRPFNVEGQARLAKVVEAAAWCADDPAAWAAVSAHADALPALVREEVAREWTRDASMEHASIAAFASFTLSLLALGAPPELLTLAGQAALDEIEHARRCFSVASTYSGRALGPGPLDCARAEPALTLRALVVGTFVEGCIGETVAAMTASAQAEATDLSALRELLTTIAKDEEQHALLAWRTVAWGLRTAPELGPVLRDALAAARASWQDATGPCSDSKSWARAARSTRAERIELAELALAQVIEPALNALLAQSAPAKQANTTLRV